MLSQRQQIAIELKDIKKLTFEQIGEVFGVGKARSKVVYDGAKRKQMRVVEWLLL